MESVTVMTGVCRDNVFASSSDPSPSRPPAAPPAPTAPPPFFFSAPNAASLCRCNPPLPSQFTELWSEYEINCGYDKRVESMYCSGVPWKSNLGL